MEHRAKVIYNYKLANNLIKKGFKLKCIGRNNYYPDKLVFIFYNSTDLEKFIIELKS